MSEPTRVLYVSDDPAFSPAEIESAGSIQTVQAVGSASAAVARIDGDVDAIVSEYDLPESDGIHLLRQVHFRYGGLPFVLCVSDGSESLASRAINAGVSEYLPIGQIDAATLGDRLRGAIEASDGRRSTDQSNKEVLCSALLETIPAGIIIETDDREILTINERMLEMASVSQPPPAVIGSDCAAMADAAAGHFAEPDEFIDTIERLIDGERAHNRTEFELTDGRTLEQDYRAIQLPDGAAHLWMYRDVTAHAERERELERKNERLDEFVSIVSHDLRGPLGVLSGSLELAAESGDPDAFDRCRRAIDRMDELISSLLRLARSGEAIAETERVDLSTVATGAWMTVQSPDAELRIDSDVELTADASRLTELLENLFRNSVEHGSTGSRTESDDSADHGGEGVTVTVGGCPNGFYVADDGPGISPEHWEDVFRSGYSSTDDGTGFGLKIVEQIAHAHGWSISVDESDDGGVRFEFQDGTRSGDQHGL